MNNEIFHEFTGLSGQKISIIKVKPSHIWIAGSLKSIAAGFKKYLEYDLTPFLFQQLVLVDDKKISIEQLDELFIDDYMAIAEIVGMQVSKLNLT